MNERARLYAGIFLCSLIIFIGCSKSEDKILQPVIQHQFNPTAIDSDIMQALDSIYMAEWLSRQPRYQQIEIMPPIMAVISVDAFHFQFPGDYTVNSPRVYLNENAIWYDMGHPSMQDRFDGILYTISNVDTLFTYAQGNQAAKYGRFTFCVSLADQADGGCEFCQPCTFYNFEWSASPIQLTTEPEEIEVISHYVHTRVFESPGIENALCP